MHPRRPHSFLIASPRAPLRSRRGGRGVGAACMTLGAAVVLMAQLSGLHTMLADEFAATSLQPLDMPLELPASAGFGFGETECEFSRAPLDDGCLFNITTRMWDLNMMGCAPAGCMSEEQMEREYKKQFNAYKESPFGQKHPSMSCSINVTQLAMVWGRDFDLNILPPMRANSTAYKVICPRAPPVVDDVSDTNKVVRAEGRGGVGICRDMDMDDCKHIDIRG